MFSYTWYDSDLDIGDYLTVNFENIIDISENIASRDYNITIDESLNDLETYLKLKAELIEEGVITE